MSIRNIIFSVFILACVLSFLSVINDLVNGTVIDRLSVNGMTAELVSSSLSHHDGPMLRIIKDEKVVLEKDLFAFKKEKAACDYYVTIPGYPITFCIDEDENGNLHFVR